ncbi:DUF2528 family protein [Pseudomonas putida]|uniref:DUF2528 family protein n=1 Tax=Pseudomonas TaxID=286 RepID=UPI0018A95E8A|nr:MULTISPECIES: DUF2528 family protein [Pseudomonas]MBF8766703.1 DUF2528 family protein [Pseudomonas putida]MCP3789427.1 DUF2528 family protein [Pseudomonas sp. N2-11]MEC4022559.1 DUF2528 family protein [Pseudomonas fulva]
MTISLNIKRFKIAETEKDFEVTLEVDLNRLTAERAQQINSFWTGAEDRLDEEGEDVIRTVIRLAGHEIICRMLRDGGADFGDGNSWLCDSVSKELHDSEGWGGQVPWDNYGWCGIRVVGADVTMPCFEDMTLSEVTP